jgi:hypothetical protein
MVKTVLESEATLRNYCEKIEEIRMDACMCQPVSATVRWNVQLVERFLCGNELILIYPTTNFYATSRSILFCAA